MSNKHRFTILIIAALTLLLGQRSARAATSVFVNEFHYDNAGADTGEAIEIAGPAGTDLAGWSLVLYNGNGGAIYNTIALSGVIPDQQGGFGTLSFDTLGLQNGAPDGFALVDAGNNVLQFLSYEGSFTAVGGPADGLTSTDVGVSEASNSAVGSSLQLTGTGAMAEDFTWTAPSVQSFGAINTGQTFVGGGGDAAPNVASTVPGGGDTGVAVDANLLVNFSEDVIVTGSWFEISCTTSGTHTTAVSGGPQSYTLDPDSDFVNNETCTATIFASQVTDSDTEDPPDNMTADFSWSFDTVSVTVGLVINEIHADPDAVNGDANGDGVVEVTEDEFVEIVNNSGGSLDLSDWTLSDAIGVRHTFPADTLVPAGCSVVVFGGGAPSGSFGGSVVQTASSGTLGLNNSGDTVTINDGAIDQAVQDYGSAGGDNQSLTLDPDIIGTSLVKHTLATGSGGALFSPGTMIDGSPFAGCAGEPVHKIHEIQGSGLASPLVGETVTIEGVVVGDFQGTDKLRGFFVQEEDADVDALPATSEGIFVFDGSFGVDVSLGDVVRVTGVVTEFFDLTELGNVSDVTIVSSGASVTESAVPLPVSNIDDLEAYEGMLVTFPQELTVTDNFTLGRFGEVSLSVNGRLFQPTNVTSPGAAALALQDLNDRSRIQLDDGSTTENPVPLPPYFAPDGTLRAGDTTTDLTGVLSYSFGAYEVQPTQAVNFSRDNERSPVPDDVGGSLKIASFNVLNYFTTIDTGTPICGPAQDQDCRGADTPEEFTRQHDKIVSAILAMDADVVGLIEIENHPADVPL